MDLHVHGLEDDIRPGGNVNSYDNDPHDARSCFDFVLANGSMSSNHYGGGDNDLRRTYDLRLPPLTSRNITSKT